MATRRFDLARERKPLVALRTDYQFFRDALTAEMVLTARSYHCTINVAESRLQDLYAFWRKDVERNNDHGFRQTHRQTGEEVRMSIDHLKQAALLGFWIRRLLPIIHTDAAYELCDGWTTDDVRIEQDRFMGFDNEICAFKISLVLASIYEPDDVPDLSIVPFDPAKRREREALIRDARRLRQKNANYAKAAERAGKKLKEWPEFRDYLMVMKYKNFSPYSFYLILKSLLA